MKSVSHSVVASAIAAVLAVGAPLAAPLGMGAAQAQAISAAVGKPLQQAQSAAKAGNIAAAQNYVNQARSAASTQTERTKVGQMAAYVYTRAGQFAQAANELERIGTSPAQLAPLYYQARQYDKAIAAAQKSGQTTIIAQSYLMQGKAADAARIYGQIVARNPNNPSALQNLAGAQYKMGDKKAYLATTQKLIRLDPTPARWRALLTDMKQNAQATEAKLGLYYLIRETGNLNTPAEVQEFAKLAIVGGQPGVAADVVKAATASGALQANDAMTARLIQAGAKRQAAALAAAPGQAKNPATAYAAGNAFLGAGQYPQAIAAYTVAAKGPNASDAALFKGVALARSGQLAASKASFAAVRGPSADVAALWELYASTKR